MTLHTYKLKGEKEQMAKNNEWEKVDSVDKASKLVCSSCGADANVTWSWCRSCQSSLNDAIPMAKNDEYTNSNAQSRSQKKTQSQGDFQESSQTNSWGNCPSCGAKVSPDWSFCRSCQSAVGASTHQGNTEDTTDFKEVDDVDDDADAEQKSTEGDITETHPKSEDTARVVPEEDLQQGSDKIDTEQHEEKDIQSRVPSDKEKSSPGTRSEDTGPESEQRPTEEAPEDVLTADESKESPEGDIIERARALNDGPVTPEQIMKLGNCLPNADHPEDVLTVLETHKDADDPDIRLAICQVCAKTDHQRAESILKQYRIDPDDRVMNAAIDGLE